MKNSTICGIPVRIQYLDRADQTLIHGRFGDFTVIQRNLVAGWLRSRGNVVVGGNWTYIPVRGTLAPRTILAPTARA
jgi:hypothetical protein